MVYYSGTEYLRDISGFSSASILTFNKFLTEVDTKFQKFRSHDIALRSRKSKKKLTEIIVQILYGNRLLGSVQSGNDLTLL